MSISDTPPTLNYNFDNKNLFDSGFIYGSPNTWVQFIILEFQCPTGPQILAHAVGWLVTLTVRYASLNIIKRQVHTYEQTNKRPHTNEQTISTEGETYIRTNTEIEDKQTEERNTALCI